MRILPLLIFLLLISTKSLASSGAGEMGAAIVDPVQMPKMKAKMFCLHNDHTRKCQQLEIKWKEEKRQRKLTCQQKKRGVNFK